MRYYWGIVLISLGIVVMVLYRFNKLDAYLLGTASTVPTATLLGLAALTTVVALCVAFKSSAWRFCSARTASRRSLSSSCRLRNLS